MDIKRPLSFIAISYLLGIVFTYLYPFKFLWILGILFFFVKRKSYILLFLLFFSIGFLNFYYHDSYLPAKVLKIYTGRRIEISGPIRELKRQKDGNLSFLVGRFPRVLVKVKGGLKIEEGDSVTLITQTLFPIGREYPAYVKRYYRQRGVYLYTRVSSGDIKKIKDRGKFQKWRSQIKALFSSSPLLGALVLGKEMEISEDIREDFIRAGIIHLFAVSGLHFGIIFLVLMWGFSFLFSREKGALLSFFVISLYFFIVGLHPSVVRAYIMILIYIGSLLTWREYDLLSALSFTFLFILIARPLDITDPGFLLSFSSVLGIYLFGKMVDEALLIRPLYLWSLSLWLWALNLPIIVNFFHRIPLFSIAFTPFLSIFSVVFIPFAFSVLGIGMFSPLLGKVLLQFFTPFVNIYREIVHFVSHLPLSSAIVPGIPIYGVIIWYLFLFVMFYLIREKRYRETVLTFLVLIVVVFVHILFPSPLGIHFISVGEGDAIFIHYPIGANILIDGGNLYSGRRVVNYLRERGIRRIDLLFITHPDIDHWGGLKEVVHSFSIGTVFINGQKTKDKGYNGFLKEISERGIPIKVLKAGSIVHVGDDLSLSVLNPQREFYFDKDNNNSIVLGLKYGRFTTLLTGDLEAEGERYLILHNLLSHYEILKVSHHGSKSSTTPGFLDVVSPVCAIISVGKNRYGHPSQKVVKLLMKKGIKVWRTDIDGNISLYSSGDRWRLITDRTKERLSYGLSKGY